MPVARRFAAALLVVGTGVLAYAVPASATGSESAAELPCVDGTVLSNLEGEVEALAGTAVVRGAGGAPICEGTEMRLTLSIYRVPDSWDGQPFPGSGKGKAWPQTEIAHQTRTLSGSRTVRLAVPVPDCGNVQIDLYTGWPIKTIYRAGHPDDRILFGSIWSVGGPNGQPKPCAPEQPPATSPAPPTTSSAPPVTPSAPPTTSSAAPTPTPTPTDTPTPPTTTPSPAPTATPTPSSTPTPTPTPTTTPTSTPTPESTGAVGAPIPVVPPRIAAPTPPVLAETGSDSTVPLLGIGIALLGAGIGLSLLGRRRTS